MHSNASIHIHRTPEDLQKVTEFFALSIAQAPNNNKWIISSRFRASTMNSPIRNYIVNATFIASAIVFASATHDNFNDLYAEELLELIKVRTGFADPILRNFSRAIVSEFKQGWIKFKRPPNRLFLWNAIRTRRKRKNRFKKESRFTVSNGINGTSFSYRYTTHRLGRRKQSTHTQQIFLLLYVL